MKKIILCSILLLLYFSNCKEEKISNFTYLNSIFVNVTINDTIAGKFILDTGSPITILDSSFVAKNSIKLDSIGQILLSGSGNSKISTTTVYKNISVQTLGQVIDSKIILIYNLKKIIPIEDGIIGINFFRNKIIKIDYLKQKISFIESTEKIDKTYTKIPLTIKNDRLYAKLKVKINNNMSFEGLFLIDTGSEFAIQLDGYYSDSLDLYKKTEKKIIKNLDNGGIGGKTLKFLIKGEYTKIANFEIKNILISCSQNKNGAEKYFKRQRIGTLGNLFLDKFDLIFDINDSILYIRPNKNYNKKFTYIRAGLTLGKISNKGILIKNVWRIETMKNKNIQRNDFLIQIDNQKTSQLGYLKTRLLLEQKGKHKLKILHNKTIFETEIKTKDLMNFL